MINVFYYNGIIWIGVLFLYFLGWSDLCTNLQVGLVTFIIVDIIVSFLIGFLFREKMKSQ